MTEVETSAAAGTAGGGAPPDLFEPHGAGASASATVESAGIPTSSARADTAAPAVDADGSAPITITPTTITPITIAPRPPAPATAGSSLGQRLRAAREAKGWSIGEVGTRLRLPVQIIQALEAEQYEKIGYGIYLRGYLNSYARLVDVPTVLVDPVVRDNGQAPPLVASGTISHSRYLYQRYSVSALYLILTGVIIVPAVLLAMRASLQPGVSQVAPLDAAPAAAVAASTPEPPPAAHGADAAAPAASAVAATAEHPAETPLVASLAPFSALSRKEPARAETAAPAQPLAGAHTLKLSLKEASWVEISAVGGAKLEYGLLPAGSVRTYASDKPLEVRLGNCNGADVETDGVAQDLAPYRRSNVARFRLFTGDDAISRAD